MMGDFSVSFVNVCLVSVLLTSVVHQVEAEVGTPCSGGKCIPVTECLPALKALKQNRRHNFHRCGFDDHLEIVCCPTEKEEMKHESTRDKSTTTTTSKTLLRNPTIRRSLQACEEYADEVGPSVTYQILGGEAAQQGEFPHMAAIGFKQDNEDEINWSCGATLISREYALSAAHCFIKRDGRMPVKIRMGVVNVTSESYPKDYDIVNITLHPQYNRKTKQNDIALLRLGTLVKFEQFVAPACLYQQSNDPETLVVTGWGTTEPAGESSEILLKASLVAVSVPECNFNHTSILLGKPITRTQICAKSMDGKSDSCQGDSGGPLQVQILHNSSLYSIVGITSYGRSCGGTVPSVYTRVYSYLDWIENIVWPT